MPEFHRSPKPKKPDLFPADVVALRDHLGAFGQEHVVQFWEQLTPLRRQALARQVEQLDLGLIEYLYRSVCAGSPGASGGPDWDSLARRAEPPHAVRLAEWHGDGGPVGVRSSLGMTPTVARQRGIETLRAGKVGVLLVAGGQGTRLGFESPKSLYPIGPISRATLLQIHVEKIRAASHRYGVPIPLYLMTSPATHEATLQFLEQHDRLGLAESQLFVFCQGSMPAIDASTGQLLLADVGEVSMSPDGHGGTVAALATSGATAHMCKLGIEQLFYLQVDNPLAPVGDPELIGAHLLTDSEMTSLAIAKNGPFDRVGNFVMIEDRLQVIEYSDFPADVAARREDSGELFFWAGSVAIHVFQVEFLKRCLELKNTLPFHIACKKVPHVDARGKQVTPVEANALKFERFIFDLLPQAQRPLVVEYAEQDSFAPLKNAPGADKDTAEYVRHMMLAQFSRWLKAAGAIVDEGVSVEISPLFALDAQAVAERIKPGRRFEQSVYLAENEATERSESRGVK